MIGETGAVLLGLLLMEINIIKIKGAEKVCKSLPTYCSNYLPLFWKNAEVYICQVFNQSIESLFLSRWLETINKQECKLTAFTETCNLKHNTNNYFETFIILPTKMHVRNTFKMSKTLELRSLTPTKGLCPLDLPQIKMKWRPSIWRAIEDGMGSIDNDNMINLK